MTSDGLTVRPERPDDQAGIASVIHAAFGSEGEALLVERLRQAGALTVSLVAVDSGQVIGHVALSPVTIDGRDGHGRWLGLAPVTVRPDRQRAGVGRRLVEQAVALAAATGASEIFVLGHADYYAALGFDEATACGWRCIYDVPADVFRVRCLRPAASRPAAGTVRYHSAFDAL